MIVNAIAACCIILALAYAGILWTYRRGWKRLPVPEIPSGFRPRTRVSVVIAARNEADSIGACLDSILAGGYPEALLEIWVVDDHSSDGTAEIVRRYAPQVRLLQLADHLPGGPSGVSYKKAAIDLAIRQSGGELIVLTDADCIAPVEWLLRLVACYEATYPAAIAAPVLIRPENRLLGRFTALDTVGTMLLTGAGIGGGWQHIGNGANLVYTRAAFQQVGGFSGNEHIASGDDVFMLQKIASAFPEGVLFLKHAHAAVVTRPPDSWAEFYRQRLRWGAKNRCLQGWRVRTVLAIVWSTCWSLLLLPPLAFRQPELIGVAAGCWSLKALADYLLLRDACAFFGQRRLLAGFAPSFFLHTVYIAVVGTAGMIAPGTRWKGRPVG